MRNFIKTFALFLFFSCVFLSNATDLERQQGLQEKYKSKTTRAARCDFVNYGNNLFGSLFFYKDGNNDTFGTSGVFTFIFPPELGAIENSSVKIDFIDGEPEMIENRAWCIISENVTTLATLKVVNGPKLWYQTFFQKYLFPTHWWQTTTSLDDMIGKGKLRTT